MQTSGVDFRKACSGTAMYDSNNRILMILQGCCQSAISQSAVWRETYFLSL